MRTRIDVVDHLGISGDTAEETAGKAAEEDDGALGERGRELETDEVKAGTPAVQSQPTTWTISGEFGSSSIW